MEKQRHSVWSRWINEKYDEFRKNRPGAAGSLTAFARTFNTTHSVVIGWLRPGADPPRKGEYLTALVERYGPEAYEALGMPAPKTVPAGKDGKPLQLSNYEARALDLLSQAPEDNQEEILDLVELYLLRHGFKRVK